jgi:hypothetical protein
MDDAAALRGLHHLDRGLQLDRAGEVATLALEVEWLVDDRREIDVERVLGVLVGSEGIGTVASPVEPPAARTPQRGHVPDRSARAPSGSACASRARCSRCAGGRGPRRLRIRPVPGVGVLRSAADQRDRAGTRRARGSVAARASATDDLRATVVATRPDSFPLPADCDTPHGSRRSVLRPPRCGATYA